MKVQLKINMGNKRYDFGQVEVRAGMSVMECVDKAIENYPKAELAGIKQFLKYSIVHINSHIAYYDTIVEENNKITITPQITDG